MYRTTSTRRHGRTQRRRRASPDEAPEQAAKLDVAKPHPRGMRERQEKQYPAHEAGTDEHTQHTPPPRERRGTTGHEDKRRAAEPEREQIG